MASHLENLLGLFPDIKNASILDIGAGEGSFAIECYEREFDIQAIEINPERVERIKVKAPDLRITEGIAEQLPYPDASFDFINMCEVIEHVQDPKKTLKEAARVLRPGGVIYLSFPNRYSFYDTHYHVYGVNWLPRFMADRYIRLMGKEKSEKGIDLQKLSEMHYYTMHRFKKFAASCGLSVEDTRRRRFTNRVFLIPIYHLVAPWYFRASHTALRKL